jgi:hypothetical protein
MCANIRVMVSIPISSSKKDILNQAWCVINIILKLCMYIYIPTYCKSGSENQLEIIKWIASWLLQLKKGIFELSMYLSTTLVLFRY